MKLLDKVRERGYNVHDRKNEFGSRVITIVGDGAWVRCVFRRGVHPDGCEEQGSVFTTFRKEPFTR